jgi:hypothetical protein
MEQTILPNGTLTGGPAAPDFLAGYVSEGEYAHRRGVSLRTCQRDRQLRQAPPYVHFGRRVFYRVEAVRDWLVKNEREADRTPAIPRARGGR